MPDKCKTCNGKLISEVNEYKEIEIKCLNCGRNAGEAPTFMPELRPESKRTASRPSLFRNKKECYG